MHYFIVSEVNVFGLLFAKQCFHKRKKTEIACALTKVNFQMKIMLCCRLKVPVPAFIEQKHMVCSEGSVRGWESAAAGLSSILSLYSQTDSH